jgi:hypothetical protein
MSKLKALTAGILLSALAYALPSVAQRGDTVNAQTVVTVVPKGNETPALQQQNLKVWADGKESEVTQWQPLRGDRAGLELVILIDGSARSSIGLQLSDLGKFIESMPPTALVGVAYMENGRAAFAQTLTADHALATKGLRLTSGIHGVNASPYFCLSDLAKHWPSQDPNNRREVLMVTDGVDRYNLRYDPEDPYLQAAITDSLKARLIVYSIYFRDTGRIDRTLYETNAGQNLLTQVAQATGGKLYWEGLGNPVSFQPYLADLNKRFDNQYELGFTARPKSKQDLVALKVKTDVPHVDIDAPQRVPVGASQQ